MQLNLLDLICSQYKQLYAEQNKHKAIVDIRLRRCPVVCNPTAPFAADNRFVQRLQSSICPYLDHYKSQRLNYPVTLYTSLS